MLKNLVFIIKANQEFIRTNDEDEILKNKEKLNTLFESISELYIPLLKMFDRLDKDNVNFKFGLVLPPVLCILLENQKIQELFVEFLEKRIILGHNELKRFSKDESAKKLIQKTIDKNEEIKKNFVEDYGCSLISQFASYQKKGLVEVLATCGTDIYMPHYSDLQEVISAQIETGLLSYKRSFGEVPEGFWLPQNGYFPGVEKLIRAYGYSYTILNARSVLFTQNLPSNGIFYPVRTDNSLAIFTADPFVQEQLFGEEGYSSNDVYRNENRDIGFELPLEDLGAVLEENTARISTGYKYWKKDFNEDDSVTYDYDKAIEQISIDADDFLSKRNDLFNNAIECSSDIDFVNTICCIDDSYLLKEWNEGVNFFEAVIRNANKYDITIDLCKNMLSKQFSLEKINPYYSSGAGEGYGENFLSSKNCWMMRYVRKASERMIDLADRFPTDTGLKTRLLNIGATELLIAQSSGLSKMIEDDDSVEFAEERFKQSIIAFTTVFDSLGSNVVSTEWLTKLESQDNLFPWMNYKIFSKKK